VARFSNIGYLCYGTFVKTQIVQLLPMKAAQRDRSRRLQCWPKTQSGGVSSTCITVHKSFDYSMHIPDGYLSPQTYVPLWGIMIPIWAKASRVLKTTLKARQVPLFAMGAAFSFVIMMFNVPTPGGTTGHATGAALIAILLGPWAALLAVSSALIIQALLFGDGGITAIGANCFNIAVVIPFVGRFIYRQLTRGAALESRRRALAGALAGYGAVNISALITALELGIQPWIASSPQGQPLYSPFPLQITVPAMVIPHLLLFGLVEALVTSGVIMYLQKSDPSLLTLTEPAVISGRSGSTLNSG
jgi:cobalt/nickel transport system permease protein